MLTKMVVWTILVQYTFRQYRGHSLSWPDGNRGFTMTLKNDYQYCFLPVLRPRRVSTSSGKKSVSHFGESLSGPVLRESPRDYLSDAPLLRAMGFLVSQHGQFGCDTPSLFSQRFPLGEHANWRCDTPPQKGYLSGTRAIPYENKANGCDTPLCDTISKRYCATWGVTRTGPQT